MFSLVPIKRNQFYFSSIITSRFGCFFIYSRPRLSFFRSLYLVQQPDKSKWIRYTKKEKKTHEINLCAAVFNKTKSNKKGKFLFI